MVAGDEAMSASKKNKATDTPKDFEALLSELDQIVLHLEGGELGLEKSVELFEKGMELVSQGMKKLDVAEKKVEMLIKQDDQEKLVAFLPEDDSNV